MLFFRRARTGLIAVFPCCCIQFLAMAAPASAGEISSPAQRNVTVGFVKSFPPYYQLDKDGQPSGFAADVMNEVAKRARFKVTYRFVENGADLILKIRSGDIDIVPSLGINDLKTQHVAFTQPVNTSRTVLFVRQNTQGITGIDDMAGRPVAVVFDDIGHRFLEKNRPDIPLMVFPMFEEALFALLSAKIDAFAYPEPVAQKLAHEAKVSDRIKAAAMPLIETKRAMAVRKDKPELLAVLDRAVGDFIVSPEYQKIYVTWFGKPDAFWTVTRVAWSMSGVVAVIFLSMAWWQYRTGIRMIRKISASEIKFRNLIGGSVQGILIHKAFKPLFANQAYADIFGYESVDDLLREESVLDHVAPHDRDRLRKYSEAHIRGLDAPTKYEFQGVRKDGAIIWHSTRLFS